MSERDLKYYQTKSSQLEARCQYLQVENEQFKIRIKELRGALLGLVKYTGDFCSCAAYYGPEEAWDEAVAVLAKKKE